MIEFKLPSLGADMDEGKLLEWKVRPGDPVKRGDVVAVVDTSKAAVDVEIWQDGTMHEWIAKPGDTIPVGNVIALLLEPGENAATAVAAPQRRRISPAARKHAEDRGIDLDRVPGTGPGGAVTLEDVERATAAGEQVATAAADKAVAMRRAIAAAMSRSKREIPHYYLSETVPVLRATEWLEETNRDRPMTGRLLMAALQLKAVALALADFPDMNGFFRDGQHEPSGAVHSGVAIALRHGGLVAPALHDVAAKSLGEVMEGLAVLVKRARAGSLRSSEMSDPTITITNLGEGGVEAVFPIIYPPQVAIVGFGTPRLRPWVHEGGIRVMPVVTASLAADHRVSDGHRGALFLAEIARRLQQPEHL